MQLIMDKMRYKVTLSIEWNFILRKLKLNQKKGHSPCCKNWCRPKVRWFICASLAHTCVYMCAHTHSHTNTHTNHSKCPGESITERQESERRRARDGEEWKREYIYLYMSLTNSLKHTILCVLINKCLKCGWVGVFL